MICWVRNPRLGKDQIDQLRGRRLIDDELLAVGDVPLPDRAIAGQDRIELSQRGVQHRVRDRCYGNIETVPHLFDVGDLLAGQLSAARDDPGDLGAQELLAIVVVIRDAYISQQPLGAVEQRLWVGQIAGVGPGLERIRPHVGIDEAGEDPLDLERKRQILGSKGIKRRQIDSPYLMDSVRDRKCSADRPRTAYGRIKLLAMPLHCNRRSVPPGAKGRG